MTSILRGKKLITQNPKENFTKIPNAVLFAKELKSPEKLILIQLHYYPSNWILAYTRLAKDLGLRKDTIIHYWSRLVEQGIIVTDEFTYKIDYSKLKVSSQGTESLPVPDGTETGNRTKTGTESVPNQGTETVPTEVRKAYLNGTESVPNEEETKEEEIKNKTKRKTEQKNLNTKPMITTQMIIQEIKERGLRITTQQILGDTSTIIYKTSTEDGKRFIPSDNDSMMKYVLEFQPIPVQPIKIDNAKKGDFKSVDQFIALLDQDQIKYYQSLTFNQFLDSTDKFFTDNQYDLQCNLYNRFKRLHSDQVKKDSPTPVQNNDSTKGKEIESVTRQIDQPFIGISSTTAYDDLPFDENLIKNSK